jgi:Ca2+/H+ antiporter, TMEM165/GDT1 family
MDWKLFATTFGAIFVAELGDKTQLAALSLSAGSASKWTVFFASALALIATTAIAVAAGEAVSRVVPPIWIRRVAGLAFVAMGLLFLLRKEG